MRLYKHKYITSKENESHDRERMRKELKQIATVEEKKSTHSHKFKSAGKKTTHIYSNIYTYGINEKSIVDSMLYYT